MKCPLYLTRKGEVRRKGNGLEIVSGENQRTFPLSMLGQIWLFGKVRMSDRTRNFFLDNGMGSAISAPPECFGASSTTAACTATIASA